VEFFVLVVVYVADSQMCFEVCSGSEPVSKGTLLLDTLELIRWLSSVMEKIVLWVSLIKNPA